MLLFLLVLHLLLFYVKYTTLLPQNLEIIFSLELFDEKYLYIRQNLNFPEFFPLSNLSLFLTLAQYSEI